MKDLDTIQWFQRYRIDRLYLEFFLWINKFAVVIGGQPQPLITTEQN